MGFGLELEHSCKILARTDWFLLPALTAGAIENVVLGMMTMGKRRRRKQRRIILITATIIVFLSEHPSVQIFRWLPRLALPLPLLLQPKFSALCHLIPSVAMGVATLLVGIIAIFGTIRGEYPNVFSPDSPLPTIGTLIIITGCWGSLYYKYKNEPPKK